MSNTFPNSLEPSDENRTEMGEVDHSSSANVDNSNDPGSSNIDPPTNIQNIQQMEGETEFSHPDISVYYIYVTNETGSQEPSNIQRQTIEDLLIQWTDDNPPVNIAPIGGPGIAMYFVYYGNKPGPQKDPNNTEDNQPIEDLQTGDSSQASTATFYYGDKPTLKKDSSNYKQVKMYELLLQMIEEDGAAEGAKRRQAGQPSVYYIVPEFPSENDEIEDPDLQEASRVAIDPINQREMGTQCNWNSAERLGQSDLPIDCYDLD